MSEISSSKPWTLALMLNIRWVCCLCLGTETVNVGLVCAAGGSRRLPRLQSGSESCSEVLLFEVVSPDLRGYDVLDQLQLLALQPDALNVGVVLLEAQPEVGNL